MLGSLAQIKGNENGEKMDFKPNKEPELIDLVMTEVRNSGLGFWVGNEKSLACPALIGKCNDPIPMAICPLLILKVWL